MTCILVQDCVTRPTGAIISVFRVPVWCFEVECRIKMESLQDKAVNLLLALFIWIGGVGLASALLMNPSSMLFTPTTVLFLLMSVVHLVVWWFRERLAPQLKFSYVLAVFVLFIVIMALRQHNLVLSTSFASFSIAVVANFASRNMIYLVVVFIASLLFALGYFLHQDLRLAFSLVAGDYQMSQSESSQREADFYR